MALPMNKFTKCRIMALGLVNEVMIALEEEKTARSRHEELRTETKSCYEGESFEISHTIDIEKEREKCLSGTCIFSEILHVGDYEFNINIYPNGSNGYKDKEEKPISMFLNLKKRPQKVKSTLISCTFSAYSDDGTKIVKGSLNHKYEKIESWGYFALISNNKAKPLKENITFRVDFHISKEDTSSPVLGAHLHTQLAKLDDELASDITSIVSDKHLLSDAFRQKLKYHSTNDGNVGAVFSYISVNVLSALRRDFAKKIEKYRKDVHALSHATAIKVIKTVVDNEEHPELKELFEKVVVKVLGKHLDSAKEHHNYLLALEEENYTHDEDFKDAVNAIRSHVFGSKSKAEKTKASFITEFMPTSTECNNEEDKCILSTQLEMFAYWKLTKKRVVDNIIMTCRYEMMTKALGNALRACLLEEVIKFVDAELVPLLSQDMENNSAVTQEPQTMSAAVFSRKRKQF